VCGLAVGGNWDAVGEGVVAQDVGYAQVVVSGVIRDEVRTELEKMQKGPFGWDGEAREKHSNRTRVVSKKSRRLTPSCSPRFESGNTKTNPNTESRRLDTYFIPCKIAVFAFISNPRTGTFPQTEFQISATGPRIPPGRFAFGGVRLG
jgi:hypothetical protein